ncbi:hypothetical protein ACWDRB_64495 [Nonomuraea sp. NPDC003707]
MARTWKLALAGVTTATAMLALTPPVASASATGTPAAATTSGTNKYYDQIECNHAWDSYRLWGFRVYPENGCGLGNFEEGQRWFFNWYYG